MNETPIRLEKEEKNPIERLVSFDVLRGGAIFFMVFFHVFMKTYSYDWIVEDPAVITEIPIILIIIAAIIAYLGMWISFFVLLSASVNTYVMSKKVLKGARPGPILGKQLLTGFMVWCFGRIQENIIGYFGYLGSSLRTGDWANISKMYTKTWTIRALDVIAWCIIINALIHYLLMIEGGHKQYLRNVLIYLVLGAIVVAITPIVKDWATAVKPDERNFFSWFLNTLVLDYDVILPYLFSSFLGSILGMTLARPKNPKKLVIRGGLIMMFILALISFLLIYFNVAHNLPATIFDKPPEIPTYLILTVGQIGLILLMLRLVEFRGKGEKFANNFIIKNFRVWSMASLSIFIFDAFEILPRGLLTLTLGKAVGIDFVGTGIFSGMLGLLWAVLLGMYVVAFYQIFVWLWSKAKFRFGAEWLMIKIQKLITKQESQKLDPKIMLNEVNWVSYKPVEEALKSEVTVDKE